MQLPIVLVLGLVSIGVSYNQRMLDPLTVLIGREAMVDVACVVMLSPAFTLPYALGQPFLGPIADAFGKALVLRVCLSILTLSTVIMVFVHDFTLLFWLRVLAGTAAGGVIPVALALIADRTPVAERQLVLTRFMLTLTLSQLFATPISAFVAETTGWRSVLLIAILLGLGGLALLVWQVPPRVGVQRVPFSVSRALATYRDILATPKARACYAAVAAEGAFAFGITPHIAPFLAERNFGGVSEAGYILAGMGIGGVLYSLIAGWLVRRYRAFTIMYMGGVVLATGVVSVAFAPGWTWMAVAYAFIGFGFYMLHSGLQAQVTEVMPAARASVISLHAFFFFMGIAGGPLLYTWSEAIIGAKATMVLNGLALLAVSLVATALLSRWHDRSGAQN